ncbi:uncharacterized protein BXZ73DRAFT_91627 [Epithele typhae]|uniref:uncharacterized protein n=1 Tax=Epithele typhae TaxID=378194 RepID=UPI002007B3A7|nr:uncharacterized protein BXZ73DRAFT_91627 [Epithele typhae]KAH9922340.1 hypothetical protein BXZ73DRAFT_91627 [Epithele typhae]
MHAYNVNVANWVGRDQFVPRFNVAPRTNAPVIRRGDDGASGGSSSEPGPSGSHPTSPTPGPVSESPSTKFEKPATVIMQTMRWGLVPHFSKHDTSGQLKTINARSEALIEEPHGLWASVKGRKRCAVVCQGYYEWQKKGKERVPHLTKRADGKLLLLAGLWDRVELKAPVLTATRGISGEPEPLWTFAIVTAAASAPIAWLHDRQPVVLPDAAALSAWLDTSSGRWSAALSALCDPPRTRHSPEGAADATPARSYPVPKEVGKVGVESPTFVQPVAARADGIHALFAAQAARAVATASASTRRGSTGDAEDARDGDSDVEIVEPPPGVRATPSPSKPSPRKAPPTAADGSAKITSFFAKK